MQHGHYITLTQNGELFCNLILIYKVIVPRKCLIHLTMLAVILDDRYFILLHCVNVRIGTLTCWTIPGRDPPSLVRPQPTAIPVLPVNHQFNISIHCNKNQLIHLQDRHCLLVDRPVLWFLKMLQAFLILATQYHDCMYSNQNFYVEL